MGRELTEAKKQRAWSMWLGRRGSDNEAFREISKATRVSQIKLRSYLFVRQHQQNTWAKEQRTKELHLSRNSKRRAKTAEKRARGGKRSAYIPPDNEELSKHSSSVSVIMALNDVRARRERAENRPVHRRTQVDIMLEIRSRIDEVLNLQGIKMGYKKENAT